MKMTRDNFVKLQMLNYYNFALNRAISVHVCLLYDNGKSSWADKKLGRAEFNHLWTYEKIANHVYQMAVQAGISI